MSKSWDQSSISKKRKDQPTPSPSSVDNIPKKTKAIEDQDQANLNDSLPYLTESQGAQCSVNDESQNSSISSIMQGEGESEGMMDLQPPSPSAMQYNAGISPSRMPVMQPGYPIMMGSMGPPPMTAIQGMRYLAPAPGPGPVVTITDDDVMRIAMKVKTIMISEINEMVKLKVNEATETMKDDIKKLQDENVKLKDDVKKLEKKCTTNIDDLEQYSRRSCLRIGGYPEEQDEITDEIVLKIAKDLKAEVSIQDIDRSHRVGRPREANTNSNEPPKPREIIVKFSHTKARMELLKARKSLRRLPTEIYINEDLTAARKTLAFKCRELRRAGKLKKVWVYNGNVFVCQNDDERVQISCESDLDNY